ncbi:serine/threonine-protein kinase [Tautonia plasticadhaerens]|uniref:Serine/threonine-protein kinase PrkC n=1 Tax=Tautonia plasticadhaerens TaxID=2527974 RepID=A0A518H9Q5_9BACT|nr:serine/threonine-protein kinase [Tautonia plasticadhaerens]QDV37537.1 Serine/threonine-protein kinase PrkC [Tautonia plasticadhaerens]
MTIPDRNALLDRIVRWEEARARGQAPTPEEFCADAPGLLEAFRRQVEKLGQVAWLDEPIVDPTTSPGPAAVVTTGSDLPRTMADRYRLDALIGEGGFGRVFRGFDTWLERPVAVKVPRVDRPVTGAEVDQCRVEARKVARLRHPGIVPVYDVGREGPTCFIVSEWIDGEDLARRLRIDRPSYRETARIVAEVAEALHHAHERGFIHRDIKPSNILLDAAFRAYLTDFGIAVAEAYLLEDVDAAGTLPYMAPEQLGGGLVDRRADLYALGVVLYELLTGRGPFRDSDPVALREQIVGGEPPPPRSIEAGVPEGLERACLRCLAKGPEDRYLSADRLAADLRNFLLALNSIGGG